MTEAPASAKEDDDDGAGPSHPASDSDDKRAAATEETGKKDKLVKVAVKNKYKYKNKFKEEKYHPGITGDVAAYEEQLAEEKKEQEAMDKARDEQGRAWEAREEERERQRKEEMKALANEDDGVKALGHEPSVSDNPPSLGRPDGEAPPVPPSESAPMHGGDAPPPGTVPPEER